MTKRKDPAELKKRGRPPKQEVTDPETAPAIAAEIIEKNKDQPQGEIVVRDEQPATPAKVPEREAALSIVGGISTAELKQALDTQTEQRKLVQEFIKENLVEGVDYGKIHVVKSCQKENASRGSCDLDYHFSKSILFKPGQEKIFSLFGITDELVKDEDAYEMLETVKDLVAYKCIMWRGDKRVGEGRGAATLSGTQGDPNSTIKKAEKRARMDACLSLGFSAYFTQDLDDPEYASQREMMNSKAAAEAERRDRDEFGLMPRDPDLAIDNQERATLHRIILKNGFTDPDEILELLKTNGIPDPQTMTSGQARDMMSKLSNSMFSTPTRAEKPADVVIEDIDDEPISLDDLPDPEPDEPELVVDDDLKNYIVNKITNLGLTGRGQMWIYQKICGRPFAKFDKMQDAEWRKAYQIVLEIEDGNYDIPDEYIPGLISSTPDEPVTDISEPSNQSEKDEADIDQTAAVQELFPGAEVLEDGKGSAVPANG